jgi:hypothetical protein
MKLRSTLPSTVAGFLVHYLAVAYVGGMGAAIAVPRSYFEYFGREQQGLAQAVLSMGTWALPVFLAVCALAVPLLWLGRKTLLSCTVAAALGMLASAIYMQVSFAASFASHPVPNMSFLQALAIGLVPTVSSANTLAPWVALAVAHWLVSRRVGAQTSAA